MDQPAITLSINYYNEPSDLKRWIHLAHEIDRRDIPCRVTVIDDGSTKYPAIQQIDDIPNCLRLYAVTKDVGFNSHGCRNLAMHVTETDWNILSDIDRGLQAYTIESVIDMIEEGEIVRGKHYVFRRSDVSNHEYALHDLIVHKDDFWMTAGYDEEFVNVHYGDRLFLDNLEQYATCTHLPDLFIDYFRYCRDVVETDSVNLTTYDDEAMILYQPTISKDVRKKHMMIKKEIIRRNKARDFTDKKVLNFPWQRLI